MDYFVITGEDADFSGDFEETRMKRADSEKLPEGVYYRGRFRSALAWSKIGAVELKFKIESARELLDTHNEENRSALEDLIHAEADLMPPKIRPEVD